MPNTRKDDAVRAASQIPHRSPVRLLTKGEDDMESFNPRARGALMPAFRRMPSDCRPGTPVVGPNDCSDGRPRTSEEIAAHNEAVRARAEAESQARSEAWQKLFHAERPSGRGGRRPTLAEAMKRKGYG